MQYNNFMFIEVVYLRLVVFGYASLRFFSVFLFLFLLRSDSELVCFNSIVAI